MPKYEKADIERRMNGAVESGHRAARDIEMIKTMGELSAPA